MVPALEKTVGARLVNLAKTGKRANASGAARDGIFYRGFILGTWKTSRRYVGPQNAVAGANDENVLPTR